MRDIFVSVTGGEGQHLLAGAGSDPGIIERPASDVGDGTAEGIFILCAEKRVPPICLTEPDNCKDGIRNTSLLGFKLNDRVRFPVSSIRVSRNSGEHGSTVHVVTVDEEIVIVQSASPIQKGNAGLAAAAEEVLAQILERDFRRVHHRVVQRRSGDREPANAIPVLFK